MNQESALVCTRPTGADAAVYVIDYQSGRVKVGFSREPQARLRTLSAEAKKWGDTLSRHWVSPWCSDATEKETALIRFCQNQTGAAALSREHFSGVRYEDVVCYGMSLTYVSTTPAEYERAMEESREFLKKCFFASLNSSGAPDMSASFAVATRCEALMIGAGVKDPRLMILPQFGASMFATAIAVYLCDKLHMAADYYALMEEMVLARDFDAVFDLWEVASDFTLSLSDEKTVQEEFAAMVQEKFL